MGAVGAERWEVEIFGRASHAGVHPEKGVSATAVASLALAEVFRGGWFGKVRQDGKEGTSNVGSFGDREGRTPASPPTSLPIMSAFAGRPAATIRVSFAGLRRRTETLSQGRCQVRDDRGRGAE